MAMKMGISIKIKGKNYLNKYKNQTVIALKEIDIFVQPKEFVCLVGPSGCGKTTLMNIIGGLIETEHQENNLKHMTPNTRNKESIHTMKFNVFGDNELIDRYGRFSAGSLMRINVEIANMDDKIRNRDD